MSIVDQANDLLETREGQAEAADSAVDEARGILDEAERLEADRQRAQERADTSRAAELEARDKASEAARTGDSSERSSANAAVDDTATATADSTSELTALEDAAAGFSTTTR